MLNRKMLLSIVTATLLLCAAVAEALAQEPSQTLEATSASQMEWRLTNRTKMSCRLTEGSLMKRGVDYIEMRKLVCYEEGELLPTIASMVTCGPEGSVTRFGRKLKVTCSTNWLVASAK